jgi:hypothetical protein
VVSVVVKLAMVGLLWFPDASTAVKVTVTDCVPPQLDPVPVELLNMAIACSTVAGILINDMDPELSVAWAPALLVYHSLSFWSRSPVNPHSKAVSLAGDVITGGSVSCETPDTIQKISEVNTNTHLRYRNSFISG